MDVDLINGLFREFYSGDSRFNPIEHLWAPVNSRLQGLRLQNAVDGDDDPSEDPDNLEDPEAREHAIYMQAMKRLKSAIDDQIYDGYPIKTFVVDPSKDHLPEDETQIRKFKDFGRTFLIIYKLLRLITFNNVPISFIRSVLRSNGPIDA